MSATDENTLLPKVRFPARDRSGVFLGLSWPQLIASVGSLLLIAVSIIFSLPTPVTIGLTIGAVPMVLLGLLTWRGESQLLRLLRLGAYWFRKVTRQDRYRRNVWTRFRNAARTPGEDEHPPTVIDMPPLPGELGDVAIVQIPGGGAFAHDAKKGLVSVTCTVRSRAWKLRDKSDQVSAYEGIVEWFSGLEELTGLVNASCRIRVDRASTTALADYVADRDAERVTRGLFALTPELEREYDELISIGAQRAMAFSNQITLTFATGPLAAEIRAQGKGLTGIGRILTEHVKQLAESCADARVDFDEWLTGEQLLEAISTALDPIGASSRRERADVGETIAVPVMGIDAGFHDIRVDQSLHATYWIAEWPRMDSKVGFLEPLLYRGQCPRVLTLQLRPVPIEKALTKVNQKLSQLEVAEAVKLKLSARTTKREQREAEDVDQREEDLVDGYSDLELRGFVTVSADTPDGLVAARAEIERAQNKARVKLARMWGQQAAAFITATVPLPTGKP